MVIKSLHPIHVRMQLAETDVDMSIIIKYKFMSNTKSRDLSYNLITYVEAGAFSGLTALSTLFLQSMVNETISRHHDDC